MTRGSEHYVVLCLLFLSQFFVGIAISLFYTLGLTYLDDNTNKKTFSLYYSEWLSCCTDSEVLIGSTYPFSLLVPQSLFLLSSLSLYAHLYLSLYFSQWPSCFCNDVMNEKAIVILIVRNLSPFLSINI